MGSKFNIPAHRMDNVYPSIPRKIHDRALAMEREGKTIIHFELGEPDFDTPAPIVSSTIDALKANKTHYESNMGNLKLRTKIAEDIKERHGLSYNPEKEILMTEGVSPCILYSIMAYTQPGDEVITFGPVFINYDVDLMFSGAKNVVIPLSAENGFKINPDDVRAAITPATKMIIINNPNNPTGVVYPPEILEELAKIAVENDLLVVSDEVYDQIVYDGKVVKSIATFPGMRERTIILNGFSKVYAMTGWRMGYIAADEGLMTPLLRFHQYAVVCIPTFSQAGLAESMDNPECIKARDEMVKMFEQRRDKLVELLSDIEEVSFVKPEGAFYMLVDISKLGISDMDFAMRLLEEEHVAVSPASAFGAGYSNFIRISYANSIENICLGLECFKRFVKKLSVEKEKS